jgi:hypothetical protein
MKSAHEQGQTLPPHSSLTARFCNPGERSRPTIFEQMRTKNELGLCGTHPQRSQTFKPTRPNHSADCAKCNLPYPLDKSTFITSPNFIKAKHVASFVYVLSHAHEPILKPTKMSQTAPIFERAFQKVKKVCPTGI